jgi:hypothetical protein
MIDFDFVRSWTVCHSHLFRDIVSLCLIMFLTDRLVYGSFLVVCSNNVCKLSYIHPESSWISFPQEIFVVAI